MTDFEKEKIYKEAVGFLTSSLTNNENIEKSLDALKSLGDYKDAEQLYDQYHKAFLLQQEVEAQRDKRRKMTRRVQWFLTFIGVGIATLLILILVYALKSPPWR